MAQGTVVNVPVSITLSHPANGSFTAMTVTDRAGNANIYSFIPGGNDTYGLSVDEAPASPAPAATTPASANSPAAGGPSCTTIAGYYPGGANCGRF